MAAPTPKYPSFDKRAIRKELSGMTIEQLSDAIKYHQQKAGMNQRIVAIAKLMLKSKETGTNESSKIGDSSTDNAQPEQLSNSDIGEDNQ